MKLRIRLLAGVLAGLAGVGSAIPASAQATGNRPWTISEANGRVTVTDAGGTRAAERGMVVPAGATVTTAAGGRAVMTRGPEFVTVSANSRIRVPEAAQQTGIVQILQDWGNALFRIDKQKNPHFGVKTPYLAAVVKGTTFSITVSAEGASMQVVEGAVEVSTDDGGAHELVRPGALAMVAASDRYRLTLQGAQTRTIDSPARVAPPAPAAALEAPAAPDAQPAPTPPAPEGASSDADGFNVIATVIEPKAVDFGSITGGLVGGTSSNVVAALAVTPATTLAAVVPVSANAEVATVAQPAAAADQVSVLLNAEVAARDAARIAAERSAAEAAAAERAAAEAARKAAETVAREQAQAAESAARDAAKAAEDRAKADRDSADDSAKAEKDKAEKDKIEKETAERDKAEKDKVEKEGTDNDRADREKADKEKAEKEKADKDRFDREKVEKERVEKERIEKDRLDKERIEKERVEKDRLDKERVDKERVEKERIEKERLEKERLEKEKLVNPLRKLLDRFLGGADEKPADATDDVRGDARID